MATVIDRITNIVRTDISDETLSRFEDSQLLTFFKQAIRRAQTVAFENQLAFARKTLDFTINTPNIQYLLPTDFVVQAGVWRTDTKRPILPTTIDEWEVMENPNEFSFYNIDVGEQTIINFAGGSNNNVPIRIRYWFDALPDNLTLSTQMPWQGRLDYPICEYVNNRAFHIDRYDLSADLGLLKDMEKKIVKMYVNLEPTTGQAAGAFY